MNLRRVSGAHPLIAPPRRPVRAPRGTCQPCSTAVIQQLVTTNSPLESVKVSSDAIPLIVLLNEVYL